MRGLAPNEAKQAPKAPSLSFTFLHFPSLSFRESSLINWLRMQPGQEKNSLPLFRAKAVGGAGMIQNHHGALIPALANSIRATVRSNAKHPKPPLGSCGPLAILLSSADPSPNALHPAVIAVPVREPRRPRGRPKGPRPIRRRVNRLAWRRAISGRESSLFNRLQRHLQPTFDGWAGQSGPEPIPALEAGKARVEAPPE